MKAIVLCAGLGTRLRPLTDTVPKPMLDVGGEPLLFRHLKALKDAGVTDVAVNLHHLPDVVRDGAGDGAAFGLRISYNEERELLGSAGALNGFPGFFDEPFFVVYGDVYNEIDLKALAFLHLTQRATMTIAVRTSTGADLRTKGCVVADPETGQVQAFVEKPAQPPQNARESAGLYLCEPDVAALVPPGVTDFGADLIPNLVATGERVYAYPTPSLVVDIGTPDGLEAARKAANRTEPL